MSLSLLVSTGLSEDQTQIMVQQLAKQIDDYTEVTAEIAQKQAGFETKGLEITLGEIVLTFLTTGTAVAMFEVFKAYFSREPSLSIELKNKQGQSIKLSAKNLEPEEINKTLAGLEKLINNKDEH